MNSNGRNADKTPASERNSIESDRHKTAEYFLKQHEKTVLLQENLFQSEQAITLVRQFSDGREDLFEFAVRLGPPALDHQWHLKC